MPSPGSAVRPISLAAVGGADRSRVGAGSAAPPSGPAILAAGSTTTYDLFFQATQLYFGPPPRIILASTYEQPTPGNWVLRMDLEDVAGAQYEVTTKAVIGASP